MLFKSYAEVFFKEFVWIRIVIELAFLNGKDRLKVYSDNILIARRGDSTVTHNIRTGTDENGGPICTPHVATISGGSEKVFVVNAAIGDYVEKGQNILTTYLKTKDQLHGIKNQIKDAYTISIKKPNSIPLIIEKIK